MSFSPEAQARAEERMVEIFRQSAQIYEIALFRQSMILDISQFSQAAFERWKRKAVKDWEELPEDAPDPDVDTVTREVNRKSFLEMRLKANILNASSLVLAHSMVDALINDLLMATVELGNKFWEYTCGSQKLTLHDIRSEGLDAAVQKLIDKAVTSACRESMLHRIELIIRMCSPRHAHSSDQSSFNINRVPGYIFDKTKIESIDKQRQAIIHHKGISLDFQEDAEEFIVYLGLTLRNLLELICETFSLNPELPVDSMEPRIIERNTSISIHDGKFEIQHD